MNPRPSQRATQCAVRAPGDGTRCAYRSAWAGHVSWCHNLGHRQFGFRLSYGTIARSVEHAREKLRMFEECRWHNEPDRWAVTPEGLTVTTNQGTDFWRETYYGFTRNSGHFFGREVFGGFTASLR